MTFRECVIECARTPGFVTNWARLRGVKLPSIGLEAAIDEATGHGQQIARLFIQDVYDVVWCRL